MRFEPISPAGPAAVTRRVLVALGVAALAAAVAAGGAAVLRSPPPLDVFGGVVRPRSIAQDAPGRYRFTIDATWGLPEGYRDGVLVRYRGVWPDTVCDRTDVVVRGRLAGDHVEAAELLGPSPSKYDPCLRWRCRPSARRPERCRLDRFE